VYWLHTLYIAVLLQNKFSWLNADNYFYLLDKAQAKQEDYLVDDAIVVLLP
jgi:hypothetical protein